ncbi:MAG: outer-membrane lipoprotein carrier protein LolA [Kofleriaceae bacterium]|nr:outer-membrane lipoprotein carrier protein LolA [Kofleriaceae bacterium]
MIEQILALFTAAMTSASGAAPSSSLVTKPTPAQRTSAPARASVKAKVPAPGAQPTVTPAATASKPAPGPAKPSVVVAANPANDAVDHVQQFYAGIKQVTAKFRQSVTNATFGQAKDSDGMVWIRKPGKMRWDYYAKKKGNKTTTKKSFISNGKYLYVVEHDNKQVMKKSLENDLMPVAVSFLYGKGDLRADFNAELDTSKKYGAEGEIVLKLSPKKPSAQYRNLILVVAPTNYRVTQSIIIDSSNNINHFRFYEPDFEKAQQDSWFEFDEKSVKDYRVIDADQQEKDSGEALQPKTIAPAPGK